MLEEIRGTLLEKTDIDGSLTVVPTIICKSILLV